ncbi:uncharacterized protein SPPG_02429 [Spizellomyces punctatus DAOM BR117]|uniref:Thioredoxin-like fold domain-containing protein n=1 Tax=Spizellomyces punctatus (strain DAOM BR117) TaxID=645134 RepID=A0A0L0HKD3_SPIPD|nr:uncharacterized protein SPPG_02429 [Spizellomyces punctatus DAOM BR117]KND01921.1 hypothetical protein SPPG_02429 [Spizellomyces punctatus DAOM BR117]|eukprot:XP_016609960.1 hypothetical protein SPPG_02429 [Spizellomyces punctatus DAOM BR117]
MKSGPFINLTTQTVSHHQIKSMDEQKVSEANVLIIYGFGKDENMPSGSGFCQKVETFARATKIPYELRATLPDRAPKGKLPYITFGDETVADSHFILKYVVQKRISRDLDASLTPSQKADSRAFQSYIEEHLYSCICYERWMVDANYQVVVRESFSAAPSVLRPLLGWYFWRKVRSGLWAQGVGRHSTEEVYGLLEDAVTHLAARLEVQFDITADKSRHIYFHGGESPTQIDVILYAFLANAIATDSNPYFNKLMLAQPALVTFTRQMTTLLFPEYTKVLEKLDAGTLAKD